MKRIVIPVAIIVLIGLAIWWFSPTKILKRRVAAFIDTAIVPASMSDIGRSARGQHLAGYLALRIEVSSPEALTDEVGSSYTRDDAAALYSGVARYCREISMADLEFLEIEIQEDLVRIRFEVDTIVELPNRRPVDGIVTANSSWRKTDGTWLLESLEWDESPRQ